MKLTYLAAALAVAAFPLGAHAQQSGAAKKPTTADAQKIVKLISADKAKLKIYCDLGKMAEQLDAAEQKKDTKTADAIADKMDDLAEKLGPEYLSLRDGLQDMPENSKEGEAIAETLADLDEMCPK